jgi:hypothetical protein
VSTHILGRGLSLRFLCLCGEFFSQREGSRYLEEPGPPSLRSASGPCPASLATKAKAPRCRGFGLAGLGAMPSCPNSWRAGCSRFLMHGYRPTVVWFVKRLLSRRVASLFMGRLVLDHCVAQIACNRFFYNNFSAFVHVNLLLFIDLSACLSFAPH